MGEALGGARRSPKQLRSSLVIPTKPAALTPRVSLHPASVGHTVHAGQLGGVSSEQEVLLMSRE